MNDTTQPAMAGLAEPTVRQDSPVLVHDDVSQRLDELADLCELWKHWREMRGHTPESIRAALVMLAREVALLADMEQKHGTRTEPFVRA